MRSDAAERVDAEARLNKRIVEAFKHSVEASGEREPGKAARFFKKWFISDHTRCLFFLFKKNLSVTDIQFAELLALLRTYSRSRLFQPIAELQFLSVDEFYDTVDKMAEAFLSQPPVREAVFEMIASLYQPIFARTVAVQSRFGSCEVYIPPELEVDLAPICAASGYIHSCGYNIYSRAAYKATRDSFLRDLKHYVDSQVRPLGKRVYFATYAHEDFDKYDLEEGRGRDLRHGLDDVKIHLEKFYLGTHRLVEIVNEVNAQLREFLEVAQPGDSGRRRKWQADNNAQARLSPDRTIWLIIDRATSETPNNVGALRRIGRASRQPGETTYVICFDQRFVNENPYHLFDENKPAWVDHTTIPHTLMGAMINITQPWWPVNSAEIVICDPFMGTGTCVFEAAKFRSVKPKGSDSSEVARLLYDDNHLFFSNPKRSFDLWKEVCQVKDSGAAWYLQATELLDKWQKKGDRSRPVEIPAIDEERKYGFRLLMYLLMRAERRYAANFIRDQKPDRMNQLLWEAFEKERNTLDDQIKLWKELCERKPASHATDHDKVAFRLQKGVFATACTIDCSESGTIAVSEINSLPENSCDVIVTDPPYGFNTDEEFQELAQLYATTLEKMILALRDDRGGQIVISVPDWSHTGRQLPLFALKGLLTQQMLITAERHSKEIFTTTHIAHPGDLFRPPYYWESERALRRAILHFRIRPRRQ